MNPAPPSPNAAVRCSRRQFTLLRLFRIQLGVAGLAAVVACLNHRDPPLMFRPVQPGVFVFLCWLTSAVAYLLARHVSPRRRPRAWLACVLLGGAAGASFAGPKSRGFDLALLGAAVGVSWLVAFGWLDADRPGAAPAEDGGAEES